MASPQNSPSSPPPVSVRLPTSDASSSVWERISRWVSEHKAVVYTVAGITVVATGAGVYYYYCSAAPPAAPKEETAGAKKKSKKARRKAEKEAEAEVAAKQVTHKEEATTAKKVSVAEEDELPEVTEEYVASLSETERNDLAAKLKAAGNKAYGKKEYINAVELYGKAILCKKDPVFYSNRAACWHALSDWGKVIEDTTAAINLDSSYVKALNRRANAYEQVERNSDALLDYTASAIIDSFRNEQTTASVERLLKKVAEAKGKAILANKPKRLPSATFVTNYLQSFRPKPPPEGLEDSADLEQESGLGQLRKGLKAMALRTTEGYAEADAAFEKALELGGLGNHEAFAYNMRGTFRYLKGDNDDALADITKSLELDPTLTQSYIKRASMHLEQGQQQKAHEDFEKASAVSANDPDIYYHRAQLNFILGHFNDAQKDYQKSIDLDRSFIFSHIQLGVTQYKMGSIVSSMGTFKKTIKNFDKVPDVYNYYGELLLDQQKYEEAIEKFDRAIEMEKSQRPAGMNVLPLINKALALFQWKADFKEAEELCQKALILDPECDIAVATMAQLLLQQGKVPEALTYFERAAELSRTEGEIVNALSYAEATRTQLEVSQRYPQLADHLRAMGAGMGGPIPGAGR